MPKLPALTGAKVVRALERAGFIFKRQTGSHVILRDQDRNRTVSVPVHAGRTLGPGILRDIIRRAGLSVDEFRRLLE